MTEIITIRKVIGTVLEIEHQTPTKKETMEWLAIYGEDEGSASWDKTPEGALLKLLKKINVRD